MRLAIKVLNEDDEADREAIEEQIHAREWYVDAAMRNNEVLNR